MCQSFSSICDRLKQRYGNYQQDWNSTFHNQFQEKNARDTEFIQYIVNLIIEQAKHNIVISELPDVIRTLHCEAEAIIRKNRMITLDEAIAQVQTAGALKYPYLNKMKPVSTEDFVKQVIREVLNRLGTIITLDRIENICTFTTCSAKQLLQTMPKIDVNEAAVLIVEDISRNQKETDVENKKSDGIPSNMNKQSIKSERESTRNSNQSARLRNLFLKKKKSSSTSHRSSKNSNKNSENQIDSNDKQQFLTTNSHFASTLMTTRRRKPKSFVPFDTSSTKEYSLVEIEPRKSVINNSAQDQQDILDALTADLLPISNINLIDHKIKLSKSKSNTQTYSIHSEEGLSLRIKEPIVTSTFNTIASTFINPTKPSNKFSQKLIPMHNSDLTESKKSQSTRHYQHNDEQMTDTDTEKCPLEDILHHRFLQQI